VQVEQSYWSDALHQANARGELKFDLLPPSAPDFLDIDSRALQNSSSNNVFNATLP
jgi:hypothetical protein